VSYVKCARIAGILGSNVNTDIIYPARHLVLFEPDEVKRHLFEDVDPALAAKLAGAGVLGGENFGCGSAREQGLTALKYAGVELVVCKSFSRAFYRNGINNAVPLFVADCPEPLEEIAGMGDELEADFETGVLTNRTAGTRFQCTPTPDFIVQVLQAGGIFPYYQQHAKEWS